MFEGVSEGFRKTRRFWRSMDLRGVFRTTHKRLKRISMGVLGGFKDVSKGFQVVLGSLRKF